MRPIKIWRFEEAPKKYQKLQKKLSEFYKAIWVVEIPPQFDEYDWKNFRNDLLGESQYELEMGDGAHVLFLWKR